MEEYEKFMTGYYDYEIPIIKNVQETMDAQGLGNKLQWVSRIGDPGLVFTLYFPIIFGINWSSGVRYFGTAIVCEWLNQILKWLFHGERPYWWVNESVKFQTPAAMMDLRLNQNPMTCETGPGSPSGHVMCNLVLWLVMADTIATKVLETNFDESSKLRIFLNRLVWNGFIVMQILISLSRVYNLNHFPHQCLLGFAFGLLVIFCCYRNHGWIESRSRIKAVLLALSLLSSALGTYYFLLKEDFNPDWSIAKAFKWCQERKWIHLDTTPFYAMVRYSGSALGLALGLTSKSFSRPSSGHSMGQMFTRIIVGVILGFLTMTVHRAVPKGNIQLFYAAEYVLNATFVFFVLVYVGKIGTCGGENRKEDDKRKKYLLLPL